MPIFRHNTLDAADPGGAISVPLANAVRRDPVLAAQTVFSVIREQTMASLSDDATTVVVGLCEFEIPLEISLTELLGEWIEVRAGHQTRTIGVDQDRLAAAGLIQRLEATIAKLRAALEPQDAGHAA
jgi:hypothetical protein